MLLQHLAERPVGGRLPIREAAARAAERLGRLASEPLPQLPDETGLADPRVADDRDELRLPLLDGSLICGLKLSELVVPADEGRSQIAYAARPHERQRTQHATALDSAFLALRLDRGRLRELEGAAHGGDSSLAGQDLAGAGSRLEALRDVHSVAGDERAALARAPDEDIARVDPDPEREPVAEELVETSLHRESSVERTLRVILERERGTESGHHRIADELLDRPAGAFDLRRHRVVEAVEESARPLGILLSELG